MSELNFELLQENIRALLKKHDLTQNALAEIAGMTQANVSKALNRNESKQFTIDQVFRIAQHFGVSIDELVGNNASEKNSYSPRAVLAYLIDLLRFDRARCFSWENKEEVFLIDYDEYGPACDHTYLDIQYPAIYFPSYFDFEGLDLDSERAQELYSEYSQCGNETSYSDMNDIIKKLLPMIELYKKKEIPEEAFQMIVDGYLSQLRGI